MKKLFLISLTITTIGIFYTSCTSPSDKQQQTTTEMAENVERPKTTYMKEFDTFRQEWEAQIDENERKIDELEEEMQKMKKEVKTEYKEKIATLKQKNKDLKDRIDTYKGETNEQWEAFKREFKRDMDELGTSLRNLGRNNVN